MAKMLTTLVDVNEYLDEHATKTGKNRLPCGDIVMIGVLPTGMVGGAPAVMLAIELDEETRALCGGLRVIFGQTSLKNLVLSAAMLNEKYPQEGKPVVFHADSETGKATIIHVPEGHVGVIGVVPAEDVKPPEDPEEIH